MFEADITRDPFQEGRKSPHLLIHDRAQFFSQYRDNLVEGQAFLAQIDEPFLKFTQIRHLHRLLNQNLYSHAGKIEGLRYNPYFDDGQSYFCMASGHRLPVEVQLLDRQMETLLTHSQSAADKIRILAFQMLRVYSIHPFDDGNKRIIRSLAQHFAQRSGIVAPIGLDNGVCISSTAITQAIKGENLGPFTKQLAENIHAEQIGIRPDSFAGLEMSRFSILPVTINHKMLSQEVFDECKDTFEQHEFADYPVLEENLPLDLELKLSTQRAEIPIACQGVVVSPQVILRCFALDRQAPCPLPELLDSSLVSPELLADAIRQCWRQGRCNRADASSLLLQAATAHQGEPRDQLVKGVSVFLNNPEIGLSEAMQLWNAPPQRSHPLIASVHRFQGPSEPLSQDDLATQFISPKM